MKVLVVIDMQNDFISGCLGSKEAQEIVTPLADYIKHFDGNVLFTRDTHKENYLMTQEGRNLPVEHCIKGTSGWEVDQTLTAAAEGKEPVMIDKPSFGSLELPKKIKELVGEDTLEEIVLAGVCTDICVISNAMILKAAFSEVPITVEASLCAGVTKESHNTALLAMKACQIAVRGEV